MELKNDLDNDTLSETFQKSISVVKREIDDIDKSYCYSFIPKVPLNLDWFTPSELKIIKEVSEIYYEADAGIMIEVTHLLNSPWDKTKKTLGMYEIIDYNLAIDNETTLTQDEINDRRNLYNIINNYASI